MNSLKGLLALLWLIAVVGLFGAPAGAQSPDGSSAPMNPKFVDYFRGVRSLSAAEQSNPGYSGLIPEPIVLPKTSSRKLFSGTRILASLPTTYDLRTLGKLTPIRDQGACGSCWAFAAIGSLESDLLPSETWDFSENNLKNTHGFDPACCEGGNRVMATATMARWSGPVSETVDPYNTGSCTSPSGLSPAKHIQEVIFLPNRTGSLDNDAIKQAVMTYGAVYTTYYENSANFNSSTKSYYCPSTTIEPNHAVCIVGWDDNYPASNFPTVPPGNGAFIMRNSWGSWWGLNGYYYISYYDAKMGYDENAVFNGAEAPYNYSEIYGYDTLGWVGSYGYGVTTAWFAMKFTATSNNTLQAAAFYTPVVNSNYELYIYKNPKSKPNSGTLMTSKVGTIVQAGYHTIVLDTAVTMAAGTKYSVVVKLTTPGYNSPIAYECQIANYSSAATANDGETFISDDGNVWSDMNNVSANASVCLKAFAAVPAKLSVTPSTGLAFYGGAGGPFGPTGQSYTLMNVGNQSLNWIANTSQPWISLSSTLGTLAPGATATVNVSPGTAANSLSTGVYSGTITFTNTTNGSGNTTQTVGLTIGQYIPSISSLKALSDGLLITVPGKSVTAVFGDCIYIEDASRVSGIRVASPGSGLSVGDMVTVTGVLGTYKPDLVTPAEREIQNAGVVKS